MADVVIPNATAASIMVGAPTLAIPETNSRPRRKTDMPKMKLEKVTGVVALSYLVLIPVAGFLAWSKLSQMDEDVTTMWDRLEMEPAKAAPLLALNRLKRILNPR